MVPRVRPVMEEVKLPVPVPPVSFVSAVVGFAEVLQHIPRSVTVAPPSDVTLPPAEAVVEVMEVAAVVVTNGTNTGTKFFSSPYEVPFALVA